MNEYTGFATEYDRFMDNIPYDRWADYIESLLSEYGVCGKSKKSSAGRGTEEKDNRKLVCELGCGTGNITRRLRDKGYDMIGIDNSEEMLEIARYGHIDDENGESGNDILYLLQDMRKFELYGTVDAFVSVCDSMNYLLKENDIVKTFRLVNNYLEAGGVFIFDMKTEYEYKTLMGNRTITDNRDDATLIWENKFDEKTGINTYDLTIYSLADEEENIFERFDETHKQRCYPVEKIKMLIEKAGMEFVCAYDAMTKKAPTDTSERIYFIAKEKKQEGKLYV